MNAAVILAASGYHLDLSFVPDFVWYILGFSLFISLLLSIVSILLCIFKEDNQ